MRGRALNSWANATVVFLAECMIVVLASAALMGAFGLAVLAGRFLVNALGLGR